MSLAVLHDVQHLLMLSHMRFIIRINKLLKFDLPIPSILLRELLYPKILKWITASCKSLWSSIFPMIDKVSLLLSAYTVIINVNISLMRSSDVRRLV